MLKCHPRLEATGWQEAQRRGNGKKGYRKHRLQNETRKCVLKLKLKNENVNNIIEGADVD